MNKQEAIKKVEEYQTPGRVGGMVRVVIVKYGRGDYDVIPSAYLTDASYTGSRNVVKSFN